MWTEECDAMVTFSVPVKEERKNVSLPKVLAHKGAAKREDSKTNKAAKCRPNKTWEAYTQQKLHDWQKLLWLLKKNNEQRIYCRKDSSSRAALGNFLLLHGVWKSQKKSHSTLRFYIYSGQKLIQNAKNGPFWPVFENLKLAVKQCYQTGQL